MKLLIGVALMMLMCSPPANAKPTICDQLSAASSVQDVWDVFDEHGAQHVADVAHEQCPDQALRIIAALQARAGA